MRRMTIRNLGLCFAATCIVLVALAPTSRVKAQDRSIIGTWIGTGTVNTPPGAPPFVFTDLAVVNPGGTLTETNGAFNAHTSQNSFLPSPLLVDFSDGYGAWQQRGDSNQFAVTFKRLLFAGANTPPTLYGPFFFPGQHIGLATIQAVLTLRDSEDGDPLKRPVHLSTY